MDLIIFSPIISARLAYSATFFFNQLLGLQIKIVDDPEFFKNSTSPKINYSQSRVGDGLFLWASGLLSERNIAPQDDKIGIPVDWQGTKAFFPVKEASFIPFDVLSATFYMVSRYEEYLPYQSDRYGRFPASESIAYQYNFLGFPVVNQWAKIVAGALNFHYPDLKITLPKYQHSCTIDVDNAWAYLHKGFVRTVGSLLRSTLKMNVRDFTHRLSTLFGIEKDIYHTYDYLIAFQQQIQRKPLWFFLVADYGTHDTNIPVSNRHFSKLIQQIASAYDVGLHPSFAEGSASDPHKRRQILTTEKTRIEQIIQRPIIRSRQHFLMLTLPETYRALIDCGISDDYSMGYADAIGFRAGVASSFPFFDLQADTATDLTIHPFAAMDVTIRSYLGLSKSQAIEKCDTIIRNVKQSGGTFTSLWHNESLSDYGEWKGWRHVYETMCINAIDN